MRLKEVTHTELFCGEKRTKQFSIHSNRFVLFDKKGRRLNKYSVERIPNYLELEVIEVVESGYNSSTYFVGFPTTHIKLNLLDNKLLCFSNLSFGECETD